MIDTLGKWLLIALYIGKVTGSSGGQRLSTLDVVRIAVAMKFIVHGREILDNPGRISMSKGVVPDVSNMVEAWQSHFDEGIRDKVAKWKREQSEVWDVLVTKRQDT